MYDESFGTTATPEHLAQAGRETIAFVRNEPRTVKALAALPAAKRTEIEHGVRLLSAKAFLYNLGFYRDPPACFKKIFIYPFDTVFLGIVLRHYVWWVRNLNRASRWLEGRGATLSGCAPSGITFPRAGLFRKSSTFRHRQQLA